MSSASIISRKLPCKPELRLLGDEKNNTPIGILVAIDQFNNHELYNVYNKSSLHPVKVRAKNAQPSLT